MFNALIFITALPCLFTRWACYNLLNFKPSEEEERESYFQYSYIYLSRQNRAYHKLGLSQPCVNIQTQRKVGRRISS